MQVWKQALIRTNWFVLVGVFCFYSGESEMNCPKCQFENPEEAKFCIKCGKPMEFHCPKCGAKTPVIGDFCMECGHNFTLPSEPSPKDLSFDEKLDKIQRYLPKGLSEKILAQREKIEGEHKQVSVMFCDMEGFTVLSLCHVLRHGGVHRAFRKART
jgi:ribosomal protein L40E